MAVLVAALDSPDPVIQEALWALFERRSPAANARFSSGCIATSSVGGRSSSSARKLDARPRNAVLGNDASLCQNACQAIVWFKEYDLLPALIVAAEDQSHPNVTTPPTRSSSWRK